MRRTHPAYQETVHPLKHEVIVTADGSTTIRIPEWDECYHSKNGAIVEAYHVFIRSGLDLFGPPIRILEIGFGTGLNALITLLESIRKNQRIEYSGVEAYPVPADEVLKMNYAEELQCDREWFEKIHNIPWEAPQIIAPTFTLTKHQMKFQDIAFENEFDLIYFDAFGYRVQPELWSEDIFRRMYSALKGNGILVTYAARSVIKRNMQAAGFDVEKLPGPPGKREMFRSKKCG